MVDLTLLDIGALSYVYCPTLQQYRWQRESRGLEVVLVMQVHDTPRGVSTAFSGEETSFTSILCVGKAFCSVMRQSEVAHNGVPMPFSEWEST